MNPVCKAAALAVALAVGFSVPAHAQQNIEKLKQMKASGTDPNIPSVPQTGKNADALRENLKRIKLPPGFKIELFAVVPDARHMAIAPSTNMLFVGTRKTAVWAVTDRNGDYVADEVKQFAPSLKFHVPNGVCWTKDGFLIVVEHNRVLNFPAAEFFYEGPDVAVIEVVPQGKLIPEEEESYNHHARTCRVGPDGMLYITLGQPFNVPPRDKLALFNKVGIGGIVRMNPFDGSKREVYATGIRNSVGIDISPKDGSVWFTDNQTDGMGDDIPGRRTEPRHQAGPVLRISVEAGQDAHHRVRLRQGPVTGQHHRPAGLLRRARGRPRPDLLHRQAIPGEVPGRYLLGAARLLESHQADWRTRHVHVDQGRRHGRQDRGVRRRLAGRQHGNVSRPAGRRRSDEGRVAARVGRLRGRDLPNLVPALSG